MVTGVAVVMVATVVAVVAVVQALTLPDSLIDPRA